MLLLLIPLSKKKRFHSSSPSLELFWLTCRTRQWLLNRIYMFFSDICASGSFASGTLPCPLSRCGILQGQKRLYELQPLYFLICLLGCCLKKYVKHLPWLLLCQEQIYTFLHSFQPRGRPQWQPAMAQWIRRKLQCWLYRISVCCSTRRCKFVLHSWETENVGGVEKNDRHLSWTFAAEKLKSEGHPVAGSSDLSFSAAKLTTASLEKLPADQFRNT